MVSCGEGRPSQQMLPSSWSRSPRWRCQPGRHSRRRTRTSSTERASAGCGQEASDVLYAHKRGTAREGDLIPFCAIVEQFFRQAQKPTRDWPITTLRLADRRYQAQAEASGGGARNQYAGRCWRGLGIFANAGAYKLPTRRLPHPAVDPIPQASNGHATITARKSFTLVFVGPVNISPSS